MDARSVTALHLVTDSTISSKLAERTHWRADEDSPACGRATTELTRHDRLDLDEMAGATGMEKYNRVLMVALILVACSPQVIEVSPQSLSPLSDATDVTLWRPMLDRAEALRGYAATDPIQPVEEPAPAIDFDFLPHRGMRIGNNIAVSSNMSQAIKGGRYGHRLVVPWTGTLEHVQFNITSNRTGETTKSARGGSQTHGFPATWELGYRVSAADQNWQPTGPLLRDIPFQHERTASGDGRDRQLHQLDLGDLPVTSDQRLLLWTYSRETDPSNNWCAVNYYANGGRPAFGLNPPRAHSRTYGDTPMHVIGYTQSSTMSPSSRGDLGGIGIRYTDGREWGDAGFDASPVDDVFRLLLGESTVARQSFSYPYYFKATHLELAAYKLPGNTPQSNLTVQITGAGLSPITLNIPPASIQVYDGQLSSSYTHDTQLFELPTPLLGAPGVTYTIELASPSTTKGRYRVHARRRWSAALTPPGITPIEPDHFNMDAEISFNGGSSWQLASWAAGRAMLPVALVVNGQVSTTPIK
jgi:hypothetical protein